MRVPNIDWRARRVDPNSLAAFALVNVNRRQRDMLAAITELHAGGRAPSDQDIALWLRWPINRVTPRRGELVAAGLVVPAGNKRGETGRKVCRWRPAPVPARQLELFRAGAP